MTPGLIYLNFGPELLIFDLADIKNEIYVSCDISFERVWKGTKTLDFRFFSYENHSKNQITFKNDIYIVSAEEHFWLPECARKKGFQLLLNLFEQIF